VGETLNITAIDLRGIRLSIAAMTTLALSRTSVVQPSPLGSSSSSLFLNVTLLPPQLRKSNKRQGSTDALSEITTADAVAKLLTPTGVYQTTVLSQSLVENGIGMLSIIFSRYTL